ncbi:MAG: glycoside hydrolase family 3 protein [Phycisphaerales bacterium]|nr:glycoside hydrolase family 3 protein [Phycisphaerales bacterium]
MSEPSLHEMVGAMLMVGVRGHDPADPLLRADLAACREAAVGGVILFDVHLPTLTALLARGVPRDDALAQAPRNIISPSQLRRFTAMLRSELPSLRWIAVDHEGGAVARLNPRRGFAPTPTAAEFARLPPGGRRREAAALAAMVAQAGFNLNFAPCVDLALNPASAVIAGKGRSFSADPAAVAALAREVISALAETGVVGCLKHFPGHGSAAEDSHLGMVDITGTHDPREIEPYRVILSASDGPRSLMVMPGHVMHRGIDPDHPASLSKAHITGTLRGGLGFNGVVVTDSLDMRAVVDRYGPSEAGESLVLAVNAGADLLLDGVNHPGPERACPAPAMHAALMRALRDGRVDGSEARVRRAWSRLERARAAV